MGFLLSDNPIINCFQLSHIQKMSGTEYNGLGNSLNFGSKLLNNLNDTPIANRRSHIAKQMPMPSSVEVP